MRAMLVALSLLMAASAGRAQPGGPEALVGWWRASLAHGGETQDIFLHFKPYKGQLAATFSIPAIGADDSPLSLVKVTDTTVELPAVKWTLRKNGATLTGTAPADMLPHYKIDVSFERSSPPPSRPETAAVGAPPKPLWKRSVDAAVYAGLTYDAARNRLLVATDAGTVSALRPGDGSVAWTIDAGAPVRATPTVAGRYIYLATDAALLKLDAGTGRKLWSGAYDPIKVKRLPLTDPNSRWDFYGSSAVLAGRAVYVGSLDGCVHAFAVDRGTRIRSYCAKDSITGTPVVEGEGLYFGSFDGKVYATRLVDGAPLWDYDTHGAVTSDLAFENGKIIAGSRSYDLTAIDAATGKPAWTRYFWFSWVESSPSIVDRTIYIGSSDGLRVSAFDSRTGARRWETLLPGWSWAKPAVGKRTVYAAVAGTTEPYIGKRDGGFAAIDRANGQIRWLMRVPKPGKAPTYGFASSPVIVNGRVFAADVDGNVFAFTED